MANTRRLTIEILGDAKGLSGALGSAGSAVGGLGSKVSGVAKGLGKALAVAGAGAAVAGVALGKTFVDAAYESQKVSAQTDAVLKSMGLQSTVTADRIGDLATALSNKNGVDDEAIQTGQNLLLTFGNLAGSAGTVGGAFDRASQIMVDMGAAMGTDASASAIQLGKALNDPTKGISALSRVGVSFTEQQKEQIKAMQKAGDMAGAQGIILGELERQFGGSAASQATAADRMKIAWGNLQEQIGGYLIPVVEWASRVFTDKVIPTLVRVADVAVPKVKQAFAVLSDWVKTHWPQIRHIIGNVLTAVGRAAAWLGDKVLTGLRIAIVAVVDWVRDHWPDIKRIFFEVIDAIVGIWQNQLQPALKAVWEALQATFGWLMDHKEVLVGVAVAVGLGLTTMFVSWAAGAAAAAAATIAATAPIIAIGAVIAGLVAGVIYAYKNWDWFRNSVDAVAKFLKNDLVPAFQAIWRFISDRIIPVISTLVETYIKTLIVQFNAIKAVITNVVIPAFQAAWSFINDKVIPIVKAIATAIADVAKTVGGKVGEIVGFITGIPGKIASAGSRAFDVIKSAITGVSQFVSDGVGKIIGAIIGVPTRLLNWVGSFLSAGMRLGSAIISGITSAFGAIAGGAADVGKAFANSVIRGVNKAIGAINSALDKVKIPVPFAPDVDLIPNGWKIPPIPTFAKGVRNFVGGLAIVGEQGPELVNLGRGSDVYSNPETRAMLGGGGGVTVIVNIAGDLTSEGDLVRKIHDGIMSMRARGELVGSFT